MCTIDHRIDQGELLFDQLCHETLLIEKNQLLVEVVEFDFSGFVSMLFRMYMILIIGEMSPTNFTIFFVTSSFFAMWSSTTFSDWFSSSISAKWMRQIVDHKLWI